MICQLNGPFKQGFSQISFKSISFQHLVIHVQLYIFSSKNHLKTLAVFGCTDKPFMSNKNKTDPLRAVNILMRKGMGHTMVSAT